MNASPHSPGRRRVLKSLALGAAGLSLTGLTACQGSESDSAVAVSLVAMLGQSTYPFELPPLPYAPDALQPAIDAETMRLHHDAHHQGYTDKLNAALADAPDLHDVPLQNLLADLQQVPTSIREAVRNNGGGYYNHALFWPSMRAEPEGPSQALTAVLREAFGGVDAFKEQFTAAALDVFGSGWAWLARAPNGSLRIVQTPNQDTPLAQGLLPLLGIDVWEHAYYLNYQNRRAAYVEAWWDVVNWQQVEAHLPSEQR